jgi:hypothetical protein
MTLETLERFTAPTHRSTRAWNDLERWYKTQATLAVPLERLPSTKGHLCPSSGRSVPTISLGGNAERFSTSKPIGGHVDRA